MNEHYIEQSKKTISELVGEVIKYNGLLVSLLHPSNFVHSPYKELWEYLEKILLRKKLYVATLSGHLKWSRIRERININVIYNRKNLPEIGISLPGDQKKVSFELIGDMRAITGKKYKLEKLSKGSYCILTTESKVNVSLSQMNRS